MIFTETKLKDAYIIELEKKEDNRGFFARSFCQEEFTRNGLNSRVAQCNISYNEKKGTLRGMHYQVSPYEETKLVICMKGSIYDAIIDLRKNSSSYCQWFAIRLASDNYKMLYVPRGFAHGFQTLENHSVVLYMVSEFYHQECEKGVRWDDPLFQIKWPHDERTISVKDQQHPDFIL